MAEAAAPAASTVDKSAPVKPERPDEEVYKTNLAKAEKELKAAEERMVRYIAATQSTSKQHTRLSACHIA